MKWINDFGVVVKKVTAAWMDLLPSIRIDDPQFTVIAQQEPAYQRSHLQLQKHKQPLKTSTRVLRVAVRKTTRLFPVGDNLMVQLFLVQANLSENQREAA